MSEIEQLFKKARALHTSRSGLTASGFKTLSQTVHQIINLLDTLEQAMDVYELTVDCGEAEVLAVKRAVELASTPALKDKLAHFFIYHGVVSTVEAANTFVDDYREEVAKNPSLTTSFLVIDEAMSWADYAFYAGTEEVDYRPAVLARARELAVTGFQQQQVVFWASELEPS